jgi:hypothetical protein
MASVAATGELIRIRRGTEPCRRLLAAVFGTETGDPSGILLDRLLFEDHGELDRHLITLDVLEAQGHLDPAMVSSNNIALLLEPSSWADEALLSTELAPPQRMSKNEPL